MKRMLLTIAGAIVLSNLALAQAAPDSQKKDSQQQPAAQAEPAKPAGGTKTAPEPKTKEETEAMKAVIAKQSDPAAMLAAADDFSAKFPDSNVRGMLYRAVMLGFEQQGNADKSYEAGRKALTFDPDDPLTLAICSSYLASHTHDTDLDKTERLADAKKMANDALTNIDQLRLNNKAQAADREQIQQFVKAQAYSSLAIVAQVDKDWATAEANYAKSNEASPDATTLLRMGFAQRMQNKLPQALDSFQKAIDLGNKQQIPAVVQFATQQRDSVQKMLDKQKAAPATTTAPAPAPSTAPTTPKQ